MALVFKDIRKRFSEVIKFNPYHDRLGRFSSAGGAASFTIRTKVPAKQGLADRGIEQEKERTSKEGWDKPEKAPDKGTGFTPVKRNQAWKKHGAEKIEADKRERGDIITVNGKDYKDMGLSGYQKYIEEHGCTIEHDLSHGTIEAYNVGTQNYVATGRSFKVNKYCRNDQDAEKLAEDLLNNSSFISNREAAEKEAVRVKDYADKTIAAMDKLVAADSIKEDTMLTRYTGYECLEQINKQVSEAINNNVSDSDIVSLINEAAGTVITEKGYMSASMTREQNFFSSREVRLAILTPAGTPMLITENDDESEVVLGRNTRMQVIGAQEIKGVMGDQIQVVVQVLSDVEKSAVRGPEMLTVEPAEDTEKIIRQMMGVEEPEEIKKYNHNHGKDGKFVESTGAVSPDGGDPGKSNISKLTGQPVRDYTKEVGSDVSQSKEFQEARKRTQESFKAFTEASDAAHEALHARKPKPRSEWDSEDELRDLMGIQPMTGEKEWREAYERENAAREQWQKDAAKMKKLMVDAQGGAKTNADFDAPKPAERSEYPGFKDSTGISYYDDKDNLKYHGLKSSVVEMTPTEYLERCAANFNSAKEDASDRTATLAGQVLQLNSKNVEDLQHKMENGTKMDMPYLNIGSNDGAQEGRHRAMAAYNLGMDKIPVLYVESADISKSAEEVEFLEYHFTKHNDYHDENGRFTFAPGGAHESDKNVSRETHGSASAWSEHIKSEREKLAGEKESEKALYACDHNIASMDDCIAAMKEGKADELLDRYFEILEQNGDYRPTKETGGQIRIDKEASENGWTAARRNAIQNATECDGETAETYRKSLETYFSGASITAEDTGIIDDYVSKAPAFNDTMYRGIAWGAGDGGYDDFIKNVQQGSEIDMRGQVSSWSSNEEVARGFAHHGDNNADSVMFVCVGNRTATPVNHLSMMGESEVLAGSDTKWTVLHTESAEWSSGARKTWVYVIEKGEKK